MAELKTKRTDQSVSEFLNTIDDRKRRAECRVVAKMMREATGKRARMWGSSIVGFGAYHYKYASGREGSWPLVGFSPRAQNLALYIMPGFSNFTKLMGRLGKYKSGKSCLYIKNLDDVDLKILGKLIDGSVRFMSRKYPVESA
ncbi:MAG: DUF1801 domain-containing protein [Woeseia sp.]